MENQDSVNNTIESSTQLIKQINKDTVHRICSGQVVLSLAVAVKELVENAIDAGATIINIFLKEYGSELIEVSDNGCGVLSENFEALTLKHYTSKIKDFTDLVNLSTLGFRGEALSSLCALSNLVVITKHSSDNIGTRISYDRNGHIVAKAAVARETGSTVLLEQLFLTLPVRRKEFTKNLKREFNKMCQILYAYCLVSKGIKFTCTHQTNKGTSSTILTTDGKDTVRENIINIFGSKQISNLVEVEVVKPDESIQNEYGIKLVEGEDMPFSLEFFISSVIHGNGRSSTDRQFYFINSRPCEYPKLMKVINEVYKQFNSKQYPFVYLNITTKTLLVDINVTPDKRQVFLESEKILLATVKYSLQETFKTFPSSYKIENLDISKMVSIYEDKSIKGIKRSLTEGDVKETSILETFKRSKTEGSFSHKQSDLSTFINPKKKKVKSEDINTNFSSTDEETDGKLKEMIEIACKLQNTNSCKDALKDQDYTLNIDNTQITLDKPQIKELKRKQIDVKVSLSGIKNILKKEETTKNKQNLQIKFRSVIHPETNKAAEEELQRQIAKTDFAKMEIIGQFNHGFIITKLHEDLFIVDQHATDEKYNFETLQQTTIIESQVLVNPKPLELTPGNECLLIDNLEIFKKNGFSFKIDESAPCTKKVALTAIPMSKNVVFGKDDVDELLFMLQDSNQTMCRPSRVRAMFASRACKKSVMIGKPLPQTDMRKLINHMGEIDQPWNCPHGRPTMRHLINLNLLDVNK